MFLFVLLLSTSSQYSFNLSPAFHDFSRFLFHVPTNTHTFHLCNQAAAIAREAELDAAEREIDEKARKDENVANSRAESTATSEERKVTREELKKQRELESRVVDDMSIYNYFHASAIAGAQVNSWVLF